MIYYIVVGIERGIFMFFQNADVIEYNSEKYVVVAVHEIKEMSKIFALACLLSYDGEPTDDFSVFFGTVKEPHLVMDSALINRLMPAFQEQLKNDVEDLF